MPTGPRHRTRRPPAAAQPSRPRASSAARGYGHRWQQYREYFLRNVEPLCRHCRAKGQATPTTDVDHITPVSGPDDPRFWDETNHQGLCHTCHSTKTATEDRQRGRGRRS